VTVVLVACFPDDLVIDGGSADNTSAPPQYQRSRQFQLRAVLYSPCGEESLLLPTIVRWSAQPQSPPGADSVVFASTNKELVVVSNSLQYATYAVDVAVVSAASLLVTYLH